jgi:hypothetical protein
MKHICLAVAFSCLLFGAAVIAHAQSASGQITGAVRDPSGAGVAGVEITVTNQLTSVSQKTTTTGTGDYSFPILPVGTYSVATDEKGFRSYRRTDINLNVNQTVRVDVELQVGQVTETVDVKASAITIDTDTSSVGQTVDQKQVTELPLDGRNFLDLLFLGNGAVTLSGEQGSMRQGQGNAISINGARPESNNYLLDGVSITDTSLVTPAVVLSIDAIQEFKEQTAIYSAEYGFSANQINIISKSGTNELHGALFLFDRNNDFDARSYFDSGIPALHQNQFGFVAGGPIIIPKLYNGKNKTFWIANYEGERIRQGSVEKGIVPTPSELSGHFTSTVIDPTTGMPFLNNTIPSTRFSRLATVALASNFWPAPNYNDASGNNYYATLPAPSNSDQQTYRLDQNLGKWGTIFGRGTYTNYLNTTAGFTPLGNAFFNEQAISWQVNHNVSIGPHLVNSFRFGHLDAIANNYGVAQPTASVTAMGFTGLYTNLPDIERTWPSIGLANGLSGGGGAVNAYTASNQPMSDLSDSLIYIKGSHTLTMGANYRHWVSNRELADNFLGNYSFAGYFTNPNPSATPSNDNVVADMLLGYFNNAANFQPAAASSTIPGNPHSYVFNYFAPYIQDDWKVSNRLTLNLGLRWDYRSIPYATNNKMFWLDTTNPKGGLCFADKSLLTDGVAGDQSYYRYCGSNTPGTGSKTPFAPRIGFAYRPFGGDKTVVRGGYGIFFDSTESREIDDSGDNYPYISRTSITQSISTTPLLTTNQLFPPLTTPGPAVPADNTFIAVIISEHVRNPYVQQWNFDIERELTPNTRLEVYYLGTKGTHLLDRRNIAQALPPADPNNPGTVLSRRPYPNFSTYIDSDWSGYSSYNSFNVKLEHTYKGLSLTSTYTWSKSLDDKSSIAALGNSSNGWQGFLDNHNTRLDYGLSDFDTPHRFVTSFVYSLPFGRGQKFAPTVNRAVDAAIGGWQVTGIVTFQRGFPYSIYAADANGLLDNYFNRANVVGNPFPSGFNQNIAHWFNPAAFVQPQAGVYGNIGRNVYTGPGLSNYNLALFKNVNFTERAKLQLRLETFNTFNHAQWSTPNFDLTNPKSFGTISGVQVPGRIAQLGVKLLF